MTEQSLTRPPRHQIATSRGLSLLTLLSATCTAVGAIWVITRQYPPLLGLCLVFLAVLGIPLLLGLRRSLHRDWFHPLAYPAVYFVIALFLPDIFELATNTSVSAAFPIADISTRLLIVLGLTCAGFLSGLTFLLAIQSSVPHNRADNGRSSVTKSMIDYRRLRTYGRWLLFLGLVAGALRWYLHRGAAYGANQTSYGSASTATTIAGGLLFIGTILVAVSNGRLTHQRTLTRQDDVLFVGCAAFSLLSGSRGDLLPPLLFLLWAHHTYIRRLRIRLLLPLTVILLVLFAIVAHVREPSTTLTSASGAPIHHSVVDSTLNDISSPSWLTANILVLVPSEHAFYGGVTYVADIERQLPGFVSNALLGPVSTSSTPTGTYAYRELIGYTDSNVGFGFSFPSESYLNFGMVGTFVIAGLVGLFMAWAYRRHSPSASRPLHLIYPVAIAILPNVVRTDALGGIKLILYPCIFLYIAYLLAKRPLQRQAAPSYAVLPASSLRISDPRRRFEPAPEVAVGADPFRAPAADLLIPDVSLYPGLPLPVTAPEQLPQTTGDGSTERPDTPRRNLGHRALLTASDQGVASLQNFAVLVLALHSLSLHRFGLFSIAYTALPITIIIARGLLLEPFMVRFTVASYTSRRQAAARAISSSAGLGITLCLVLLLIAVPIHGTDTRALVAVAALTVPFILLQDSWRVYFVTSGRPASALLNDAVCLAVTGGLAVWLRHSLTQPYMLIGIWGAGSCCGFLVGMAQSRLIPKPWTVNRLFNGRPSEHSLGLRLAGARSVEAGTSVGVYALMGSIVSVSGVGRLGTALAVFAPLTTLVTAAGLFLLPEGARYRSESSGRLRLFASASAALLAGLTAAYALVVAGSPHQLVASLVGPHWSAARSLLLPVAIWTAAAAAKQAWDVNLRVLGRGQMVLGLSALTGGLVGASAITGAALAGIKGGAWGYAVAYAFSCIVYSIIFLRLAGRFGRSPTSEGGNADRALR